MSDEKDSPNAAAPALSPAQAAKLVKRQVPEIGEDRKPTGKLVDQAIRPDEVLDFAVRGDELTVVTIAGEKLTGVIPAKAAK